MSNNLVEDNNVIIELSEQSPDMAILIAKITSLSLAVETLRNENSHLLQELVEKDAQLEDIVVEKVVVVSDQAVVETQHSVCARDIAMKAEVKVMDFIFPECRRKPYCLRFYKHLLSFISNPTTDNTSSFAPIYWNELDDNVKLDIMDRIEFMKTNSMYLKTHIEGLKIDNVINNTVCGSVDEVMEFMLSCDSDVKDELVEAMFSIFRIDWNVFKEFKKDFWVKKERDCKYCIFFVLLLLICIKNTNEYYNKGQPSSIKDWNHTADPVLVIPFLKPNELTPYMLLFI
jgi:hypothetical protein